MNELISFNNELRKQYIHNLNIKSIGINDFVNVVGRTTLFNYTLDALIDSEFVKFDGKKIRFKKKVNPCQFAGFFFESFFATYMNKDYYLKDLVFRYTSRIEKINFWEDYGYESYQQFLRCLSVIAKGSLKTKVFFTSEYCNACKNDIVFIIKDRYNGLEDRTISGIQIKAINGKEKSEIVEKIANKKYKNVLTVLQDARGEHSIQRCYKSVNKMLLDGEITKDQGEFVLSRIICPDQIGVPQAFINQLYNFIIAVTKEGFRVDESINIDFFLILKSFEKIALAETGQKIITTEI